MASPSSNDTRRSNIERLAVIRREYTDPLGGNSEILLHFLGPSLVLNIRREERGLPFSSHDRAFSSATFASTRLAPSRINVNIFSSPAYKQLVVGRQQRRPLGLVTCPDKTQVQRCLPLKISRELCGCGPRTSYCDGHRIRRAPALLNLLHFLSIGSRSIV